MNTVQRIVIAGAAAWLAAAGSTADAQTQDFVSGMSVNAIVRDAPFSGEGITTVTQTLADGTRIDRTTTSKLYRDSAGRLRREQTIMGLAALDPSRESETLITIVDPVARLTYVLNPTTRMARRAPPPPPAPPPPGSEGRGRGVGGRQAPPPVPGLGGGIPGATTTGRQEVPAPPPPPPPPPPPGGDVRPLPQTPATGRTESLGTRQIEGLMARGRRTVTTIPVGQIGNDRPIEITDEQWESAELKLLVLSRHHDPRTGDVEYRLTNVSRAEPAFDLFTVPADYTVVDSLSPRRRQ
ncbi:MAG TPA: hypothetical protein VK504_12715 [Vicinamibacterales bacterium]|nr:hypothetical protein [Vicinamibacterales bacterium]